MTAPTTSLARAFAEALENEGRPTLPAPQDLEPILVALVDEAR